MHEFMHQSGALIRVDDNGKKTIFKYGKQWKTLREIALFEQKHGRDHTGTVSKETMQDYLKRKGEF